MYILDTNTIIYYFKDQGNISKKMSEASFQELYIPTVVLFELNVGISKSNFPKKRVDQLNQLLRQINLIDFNQSAALAAAKIRSWLEQQGTPIGPVDTLIAGTALSLEAILVTHNTREFSRIPDLRLEDWF